MGPWSAMVLVLNQCRRWHGRTPRRVKSAREYMDIVHAYQELGTYRAAAALCGTTPKTIKRVMARRERGETDHRREAVPRNTDGVTELIAERVRRSHGRISAKRLLPTARAAGYVGSERSFRRAVARANAPTEGAKEPGPELGKNCKEKRAGEI